MVKLQPDAQTLFIFSCLRLLKFIKKKNSFIQFTHDSPNNFSKDTELHVCLCERENERDLDRERGLGVRGGRGETDGQRSKLGLFEIL